MKTCWTCKRRSQDIVQQTIHGAPLYECTIINRTPRIEITGAHVPWIWVRADFGCVLWRERKIKP